MVARGEPRPVRRPRWIAPAAALAALLAAAASPGLAQQATPIPSAAAWPRPGAEPRLTTLRVIRVGEIVDAADIALRKGPGDGIRDAARVAGLEARTTLFPGRPIGPGDVGPPAAVDRNQIVTLRFSRGRLRIEAEGRALDRGAVGTRIRVMNLASRATVTGRVVGPELVEVGG